MFNRMLLILLLSVVLVLSSCAKNETFNVINQENNFQQQTAKIDSIIKPVITNSGEIEKTDTKHTNTTDDSKQNNKDEKDNANGTGKLYKNEKLGFSFVIPDSWSGKYVIKEDDNGLQVFFKPSEPVSEGEGLLFAILKKRAVDDESTFDSVGEPRLFQAKGITYIIGGSTDIGFSESHKEFVNFINMKKEVRNVVGTIKSIN